MVSTPLRNISQIGCIFPNFRDENKKSLSCHHLDDLGCVVVLFFFRAYLLIRTSCLMMFFCVFLFKSVSSHESLCVVDRSRMLMFVDEVLCQNHVHLVIPICCCAMFLTKVFLYNLRWPHDLLIAHKTRGCQSTCHHSHIMVEKNANNLCL